jgi:hypothetical protein
MVRKDERGVVIPAPLQFNDNATAGLPRLDDPHRGPAVTDAYELSGCRIDLMERSRSWQPPEELPQHLQDKAARIGKDRRADWLQLQWASQEVTQAIANAMRTGELPIWVAPMGESERLVAPGALVEVDESTIVAGVYCPPNDRGWLYGRPLFVKRDDWVKFAARVDSAKKPAADNDLVPANRQLDHASIIERAARMLREQPNLSKGSAAASIVADLPSNPRTKRPRDTRHIERLIAHLWEGES